jgi:hypothetical protein
MNSLTERTKSRKFISFAFVLVVSTICLMVGVADFEMWADIVKWDMGFYFTANSIEHTLNRFKSDEVDPEIDEALQEYEREAE